MILWTHIFDLLTKLILIILLACSILIGQYVSSWGVVYTLLFGLVSMLFYWFILRTIGSWVYCFLILRMRIGWKKAAQLNGAFSPILDSTWLPMLELKNLSNKDKYQQALNIYQLHRKEQKETKLKYKKDWEKLSKEKKVIIVLLNAMILSSVIIIIFDLPPIETVNNLYCRLTSYNNLCFYNPILTYFLIIMPFVFGLIFLNRRK